MSGEVRAETAKIRGVSDELEAVREQVADVLSTLQGALGISGPAVWGNDDAGRQACAAFEPQSNGMQSMCSSYADTIGQFSEILDVAATMLDNAEHTNTQGFTTGA